MKKTVAALAFLLISGASFAQSKNDPAAKALLDGVSTKFKAYSTVQSNFSLKVENSAGKLLSTKKGTVYMKGAKYHVTFPGQEIFSDGKNVWTYDKSSNEVTITKIDPSSSAITPQKLFTNFYDKDFLYKLNGKAKLDGKDAQEVELTPTDKSKPFFKALVYVSDNSITGTKVFEKSGNRFTYSTSGVSVNKPVSEGLFVFNPGSYPGVEVVDLR